MQRRLLLPAVVFGFLLLAGCSAPAPSDSPVASSDASSDPNQPIDYPHTGLDVSGGGDFVTGTAFACTAEEQLIIDDLAALTSAKPGDPVPSLILSEGTVTYTGGFAPGPDKIQDGIVGGTGSYEIRYADGAPVEITGTGKVTVAKDGVQTEHDDSFRFTVTPEAHPDMCVS